MTTKRTRGYSLVEMLVVVGIIVLVTGLVLPAVMKARRASRAAICLTNLREIGRMIHAYAEANNDSVPIGANGVTVLPDIAHGGPPNVIWSGNIPQPPLGPMLLNGMLYEANAKLCYCPIETTKGLSADVYGRWFPQSKGSEPRGPEIPISYTSRPRPVSKPNEANVVINNVVLDAMMPHLTELGGKAIVSEPPVSLPSNHGSEKAPAVNVLYNDGSARQVTIQTHWRKLDPFGKPVEPPEEIVRMPTIEEAWPWLDRQ